MLLATIFPRFPNDPRDCRYHLQAFRHLYVLATEARCVDAVDVDSGHAALVPLRVALHAAKYTDQQIAAVAAVNTAGASHDAPDRAAETSDIEKVSPCHLPPLNTVKELIVCGPRYWPRELHIGSDATHAACLRRRILWVKRKIGHLSYLEDPQGLSSIFCRHFPSTRGAVISQRNGNATEITTQ